MTKLETGTYEHPPLQAVWPQWKQQRRFTFHTREEVAAIVDLIGQEQFLQDNQPAATRSPAVNHPLPTQPVHQRQLQAIAAAEADPDLYAVAQIGTLLLYVGNTRTLKDRWPPILANLEAGRYPHAALQNAWTRLEGQRNFKFHTRKTLLEMRHVINIEQFFQDIHLDMAPE
ncbi:hypothetical protein [Trichothermofontia sp.]